MEIVKLLGLAGLMLVLQACSEDDFCNCLQKAGSTVTESRQVPGFTKIQMNNNIDLEVIPDSVDAVFVTCGSNLADGISTVVESGTLVLKNINKCNWLRSPKNKFTVRVHTKKLEYILSQGTGDIWFLDSLRTSPFLLESSNGTGDYHLLFSNDFTELKLHSGPADLYVKGAVRKIYFYNGANGYIYADEMLADTTSISTYSTGDSKVYAKDRLDVNIGYSGDVFYRGQPVVTKSGDGSGQLIPL